MSYMKIRVGKQNVNVPVQDAVRINHDTITEMAERIVAEIVRDKRELMRSLSDLDRIEQRFSSTGDVMLKAVISRDFNDADLRVELYVCKIERYASFSL